VIKVRDKGREFEDRENLMPLDKEEADPLRVCSVSHFLSFFSINSLYKNILNYMVLVTNPLLLRNFSAN